MRLSLRVQIIEAMTREYGGPVTDAIVRKIRLRPEIEIIATVNGSQREMRWSYADGLLTRLP